LPLVATAIAVDLAIMKKMPKAGKKPGSRKVLGGAL
jgi:hypothetical protein